MCKKNRVKKEKKAYIFGHGKRGFTLAELSVVLALIAILSVMIVTFSVFMNTIAAKNQAEYDFLADSAELKDELCIFAAENDTADSVFSVSESGVLTVSVGGEERIARFDSGVLTLGDKEQDGLDTIGGVIFETGEKLIKCTVFRDKNGEHIESVFVFSLRSARIEEVAEDA